MVRNESSIVHCTTRTFPNHVDVCNVSICHNVCYVIGFHISTDYYNYTNLTFVLAIIIECIILLCKFSTL